MRRLPGPCAWSASAQARAVTSLACCRAIRGATTSTPSWWSPTRATPRRLAVGAAQAGLRQVEVREADAAVVAGFADALPADVLLLCGIFGNVSDEDIKFTVEAASAMCRPGGTAIWTRHRRPPDLTPQIRAWFAASGFDELAFDALDTEDRLMSVGANRLRRAATAGLPDRPLFTFRS